MTTKESLSTIQDFFELRQSHFQASAGFETDVDLEAFDLAAWQAKAQEEIDDRGEGASFAFTSDTDKVLSELADQIDAAAEDGLDESELDDQTAEQVMDDVNRAWKELNSQARYAVAWNTGSDEETRFTFEIFTRDGCSLDLVLGYD